MGRALRKTVEQFEKMLSDFFRIRGLPPYFSLVRITSMISVDRSDGNSIAGRLVMRVVGAVSPKGVFNERVSNFAVIRFRVVRVCISGLATVFLVEPASSATVGSSIRHS